MQLNPVLVNLLKLYSLFQQTSDDEPSEEKDRFVAQLYKFMDERGLYKKEFPIIILF